MSAPTPVFDGHNDLLLRLHEAPERREAIWLGEEGGGHLDLPRMRSGGLMGGFFAIYVPSPKRAGGADPEALMDTPPYRLDTPEPIGPAEAEPVAMDMARHLLWMERASSGALRLCRGVDDLEGCLASGAVAAILHMEGAEAIGPDLDALHLWHALGLRSLGPVWSRPNQFGHGVPFAFPSSPDDGPGLTPAGRDLVRLCDELGILIDLSHLNEAGFWDVARLSRAPLVATHSNAHTVCPSSRNLTDRQLDAIRDTGGVVGLNFATAFLRPDGRRDPDTGLDAVLRHLDHLLERLGETGVALGSDFDGATVPAAIGDVAGLPALIAALADHGFDDALIHGIAHRNWLALLRRTWA